MPFVKALAASVGIDPEKDMKLLAVGVGAPGRLALQQKQVEALALWDTLQAAIENSGFALRRLDLPMVHEMLGRPWPRATTSSPRTPRWPPAWPAGSPRPPLFGLTNPEAAVRIHWKVYPQTRPQGVEEAKALKDAINVFNSRFELQRVDNRADKRFGAASLRAMGKLKSIYKDQKLVEGTVPAADFYSGALVDQINRFDKDAIVKQAREYKPQ